MLKLDGTPALMTVTVALAGKHMPVIHTETYINASEHAANPQLSSWPASHASLTRESHVWCRASALSRACAAQYGEAGCAGIIHNRGPIGNCSMQRLTVAYGFRGLDRVTNPSKVGLRVAAAVGVARRD